MTTVGRRGAGGIKEIAIADRCGINWPAAIIRGARLGGCKPIPRIPDTHARRRRCHKFRVKQRAISTPHKSRPNGHRRCGSRRFSSREIALEFQLTLLDARGPRYFPPAQHGKHDVQRVPMRRARSRIYRTKIRCAPKNCKWTAWKIASLAHFRGGKAFRNSAASLRLRCSHNNLYTLVFVFRKHFSAG